MMDFGGSGAAQQLLGVVESFADEPISRVRISRVALRNLIDDLVESYFVHSVRGCSGARFVQPRRNAIRPGRWMPEPPGPNHPAKQQQQNYHDKDALLL